MIAERLLPHLPVYEILNTLRLYQDWKGEFLRTSKQRSRRAIRPLWPCAKTTTPCSAICRYSNRNFSAVTA